MRDLTWGDARPARRSSISDIARAPSRRPDVVDARREREARESSSRRSRSIPPVRAGSPRTGAWTAARRSSLFRALARVYPERAIRVRRCRRARAFVCAASDDGPGPARTPRRSPLGRVRSRDREDRSSRGLKARRDGSRFATDRAGVANRLNGSIDRSDAATRWTFPAEFSHLARSRQIMKKVVAALDYEKHAPSSFHARCCRRAPPSFVPRRDGARRDQDDARAEAVGQAPPEPLAAVLSHGARALLPDAAALSDGVRSLDVSPTVRRTTAARARRSPRSRRARARRSRPGVPAGTTAPARTLRRGRAPPRPGAWS